MERFTHFYFIFFALTALVWMVRSKLALRTLATLPVVRKDDRLPDASSLPLVTVVIPAKNEARNIRACVDSFLAQTCEQVEILVINDNSTDGTESILASMGAVKIDPALQGTAERSGRLRYVNAPLTPEGWTGKNFALHSGVPFARGEWLLFTDADTRHQPECVDAVLAHVLERDLELLTLLPYCLTGSFFENMVQPPAMAFMGLWFPMEQVNDPASPVYFGNGQFLFIKKDTYHALGGHESVRGAFLEDFALVKKAKAARRRVQCASGTEVYGTRMYDSVSAIWRGWRRIYLHAFESNARRLCLRAISVLAFSTLPFILLLPLARAAFENPTVYGLTLGVAIALLLFVIGTCWKACDVVRGKRRMAFLHPFAALVIGGILLDAFGMAVSGKKTTWR